MRAPPQPAARKPVAGIAAACVIALYLFIWARSGARNPAYQDTRAMANGLYTLGSMVLLVGALMSVGGHRWGNRVVRVTSWIMLPLVILLLFVIHDRLREVYAARGQALPGDTAGVMAFGFAVAVFPWVLLLFLFRRSKYP